ncbi:MAG: hypothetical protein R6T96_04635, partial [Longimicrobiales bacterium]
EVLFPGGMIESWSIIVGWIKLSCLVCPLKEECFRIAHMGDLTLPDVQWLTEQIEDILDL